MFRVETWICTTLFAVGIIGGMTYLNLSGSSLSRTSALPADVSVEIDANNQPTDVESGKYSFKQPVYERMLFDEDLSRQNDGMQSEVLQLADQYLIAGNYALALENYYDFEKSVKKVGSSILLRQALCCEMQRRFRFAEDKYYRALTGATSESHRLLGFAGLARCLTKSGKRMEALDMLAELNLKFDQFAAVPDEVRSQIAYQFAQVLESYAVGDQNDLTRPLGVAFENTEPKPEVFLNVVDQIGDGEQALSQSNQVSGADSTLRIEILQRPSNSLSVISASISGQLQSVGILLGQIAAQANQELVMSERAQAAVRDRARTIELRSAPLSSVLDQLLVPFDLVWYQIDSELHVIMRTSWIRLFLQISSGLTRQLAYRRFELEFDDDMRRQASMLSRANLAMMQKKLDQAANQFQELKQLQPNGLILAKFFFNQGKLNLLLNRPEEANRFLYFAVDQTMNPDIQASGYCLLGGNFLSLGNLETSIKLSRRGLATAIGPRQKRLASLNLARAYLLNQDPYSANRVLFENREFYESSSVRTVASTLGAYARYVGVSDDNGIRIARNRLFIAIAMIPDSDYQSFADAYIAGLAFERLGFREKAVNKFLFALAQPDVGQWRRQILFELAVLQKRLGRPNDAIASLQSVVQSTDDLWNRLAWEQLAKIYIESGQPEDCIKACKILWALDLEERQQQTVLQLLGDAYELKGEHYTAALCFAGMLPDRF